MKLRYKKPEIYNQTLDLYINQIFEKNDYISRLVFEKICRPIGLTINDNQITLSFFRAFNRTID